MDSRVQIAIALMRKDLQRTVPLSELARYVNLSPSRLRHLFNEEVGIPPYQYLRTLRIEKAKELLEKTWLSVSQIAFNVGWQERSHFEREFKRQLGMTPVRFRATFRFAALMKEAQHDSKIGHKLAVQASRHTNGP